MNEERLKLFKQYTGRDPAGYGTFLKSEIGEMASVLLAAQKRVAELESLLAEQHTIIDEMNRRGKKFDEKILLRLTVCWNKQRKLLEQK